MLVVTCKDENFDCVGVGDLNLQSFLFVVPAQRDPAIAASESCTGEKQKVITGLLDGSGEYTLVYEDDEGDQMLVGDVPWE